MLLLCYLDELEKHTVYLAVSYNPIRFYYGRIQFMGLSSSPTVFRCHLTFITDDGHPSAVSSQS